VSLLILLLVASVLAAGFPPFGGVARADNAVIQYPPADLLDFPLLGIPNQLWSATPAQITSLQNLQQTAITNTLTDHGLPAGDAAAVQTWGREDALGELWALFDQAIQLPACSSGTTPCRTTDQQNAVDWLQAVYDRQTVQAAQNAGLEYVKWDGGDQTAYENLLATHPSESALQNFFCNGSLCPATPLNYSGKVTTCPTATIPDPDNDGDTGNPPCVNFDGSNYTSGYCVYQPPGIHDDEYSDASQQTCQSVTTGQVTFTPPGPSYDQLVNWGEYDATAALTQNPSLPWVAHGIAIGLAGGAVLASGAAILAGLRAGNTALEGLLVGSRLGKAIFPYAARAVLQVAPDVAAAAAEATGETTAEATAEVAGEVAATGGAVALGAVIAVIASVLGDVASAIEGGIIVSNSAAVPVKLATLIANPPTTDLATALSDTNQGPDVFALFLGATMPLPLSDTCVSVAGPTGGRPCLNAPAIPDPVNSDPFSTANEDPIFAIQQQGYPATWYANSLTWKDQNTDQDADGDAGSDTDSDSATDVGPKVIKTARLHESWFITQVDGLSGSTTQTLRMHYTDWSGTGQNAWLIKDPQKGYMFLSVPDLSPGSTFDPSTCISTNQCSYSASVQIQGSNNLNYSVSVVPAQPPVLNLSISPNPVEGSPVTFTANGSSPLGLPVTYQWQFEEPTTCTLDSSGQPQCPSTSYQYSAPVTGAQVTHTFNTFGVFSVILTATDSTGRSSTNSASPYTVPVGATEPVLALSPAATSADPTCGGSSPCDVHEVQVGNQVTLTGTITHGGSEDGATVTVKWGDNTLGNGASYQGGVLLPGGNMTLTPVSDTEYSFSATHTYATVGTYQVAVQALGFGHSAGGTTDVSTTSTETVWDYPALRWTAPSPIVYGTKLDGTQLDATASGPGSFSYTVGGTDANGAVLSAGGHTLTASFTPTDAVHYHTPAPITVGLFVKQAPLTVTESDRILVQGGTLPDLTPGLTGLVDGDAFSSTGVTCGASDRHFNPVSSSTPLGADLISCQMLFLGNYAPTFNPGTLFITKNPVTLTASDTSISGSAVVGLASGLPGSLAISGSGGSGTVAVGQFSGNPGPSDPYATTNAYFDAFLAPGGTFTSAQVLDCNLGGGNLIDWFDGTSWQIPSQQSYDAATGCVTMTVTDTTVPSLSTLGDGFFGVLTDTTPPTTTTQGTIGTSTTTYTPGTWTNQPVQVTLTAKDNPGGSGVNATYYKVDNGATTQYEPGTTITVSGEGKHTLTSWSTDFAGNVEDQTAPGNTLVVNIDTTPPVVTYTGNAGTYSVDQTVAITCAATDPMHNGVASGIASNTCKDLTGPAYTFALGTDSFSATATDRAGNVGSNSTSFAVTVTFVTLCNLTKQLVPAAGHPDTLCLLLQQAAKGGTGKAGALTAYRHLVQAQVGKSITQAQATVLENLSMTL
jgi:hypothetical protein